MSPKYHGHRLLSNRQKVILIQLDSTEMPRRAVSHVLANGNVRECHRMLQIVMQQERPGQPGTILGFSLNGRQKA